MSFDYREIEAVLRVMGSGCLSGYRGCWGTDFFGGPEIQALENEWAEYFGVKHAIACNSNSSGLWMACNAILKSSYSRADDFGDNFYTEGHSENVIVTPYSMTISASVPLLFGAKPIFADIEHDYFCLDPADVEKKITNKTKAIIVVDLFGQPYDADAINEIAKRKGNEYGHKIYVIEDAAQAPGAKYKGKYAGTLGDIGVFSLNYHKHIHCGEGGIVVTNDDDLALKLRLSMNHAEAVINDFAMKEKLSWSDGKNDFTGLKLMAGMNLRMTELQAAIAREQLKKLADIVKQYQDDARYFPIKVRPECKHSFYRYAWNDINGNELSRHSKENNIKIPECVFNYKNHYITPIFMMPLFKNLGYDQIQCPVTQLVERNITLAWGKVPY